jgi:tripartite ATP-independent transporter DctP family solute receptor
MMKKLLRIALFVLLVLLITGVFISCGGKEEAVEQEEVASLPSYKIRVSLCNAEDHPQSLGAKLMKELIEKETDGRVTVSLHLNSQLGAERESVEQVQNGVLEMATASAGPLTTFDKNMMVLDIPFAFSSYEQAWMVLDGKAGQDLFKSLESVGLKGLAYMENGFRQTTNNVRPITKPEDFNGIKIRTMEAPMHMENFSQLGANPTPVPWSELYQTLSQNIVDGQENPLANLWELQLWEVQDYVSLTNHIYDPMPLVTNLEWYNGLPASDQMLISRAALLGQNWSRFINKQREEVLKELLEEKGMKVNELSAAELKVFSQKSQPAVVQRIKSEIDPSFVDNWLAAIEEADAAVVQGVE